MNEIIGCFKIDGSSINIVGKNIMDLVFASDETDYDFFVQIKLAGNHALASTDGNIALVSKQDIRSVLEYKWYLGKTGYPVTYGTVDETIKFGKPIAMHQFLSGPLMYGYVVDHINRNKLDNRRENLRICTSLQNSYNRPRLCWVTFGRTKAKTTKNKYKGVKQSSAKNPTFSSTITKNGIKHTIGCIETEKEADEIYDMMAEELFGQYAGKNINK